MHMSDALVSPAVGITGWGFAAALIYYCGRRLRDFMDSFKLPLMGVMGAFVFAAQMINFSIPGTGSSGHLGGGLLLAILLGPHAAFLVISSVLVIQAFLFADGGLLSLGCNIINMGFIPAFVAYPLIFKPVVSRGSARGEKSRITAGAVLASVAALQLGAFCVVLETVLSGVAELPFRTFLILMQPIHLAIGAVEGLVTAAVVVFLWNARPDIFSEFTSRFSRKRSPARIAVYIIISATVVAGALSWFASGDPDGLEWSIIGSSGSELEEPREGIYPPLADLQERTSLFPDYLPQDAGEGAEPGWPDVNAGTSLAGLVGGAVTFILISLVAFLLKRRGAGTQNGGWKRII